MAAKATTAKRNAPCAKAYVTTRSRKAYPQGAHAASARRDSNKLVIQTYDKDTSSLAQAYQLEDWAANEQLLGDYGRAVRHLEQASTLTNAYLGKSSSAKALLYFDLAAAAESAGQVDVAKQAYLQCLEYGTSLSYVHLKIATLLARLGDTDQAYIESRKAIELDPAEPRAHLVLGLLLEKKGQFKDSECEKELASQLLEGRVSNISVSKHIQSAAPAERLMSKSREATSGEEPSAPDAVQAQASQQR